MYHCIVNPVAGRGNGRKMLSAINTFMRDNGKEIGIKETRYPLDASQFAKEACANGSQGIIGIGGDGTIQEIVTGMLNNTDKCSVPLYMISCGSGNDWQRSFKQNNSIKSCLSSLIEDKTQTIDAIWVNGMACLNIANIGIDARIVRNAQRFKKFFGKNAYVISAIISILSHKNTSITVYIEDTQKMKGSFTLVAACNGQYYGGGMRIAPSAIIDDGQITLCLVNAMGRLKAFTLFPLVLFGKHTSLPAVRYIKCNKVTFVPEGSQTLCLDGNLYEFNDSLKFKILPGAIQIV